MVRKMMRGRGVTDVIIVMLDKRTTIGALGFIPSFLDPADPRPAVQQFDSNYQSGWHPQSGFTLDLRNGGTLHYPGDPPFKPLAMIVLRDEIIFVYRYGYVAVVQPGGEFEACRMD
jgi:hypothetical protein